MNQESRIMGVKNKLKGIIHDSLFMIHSRGFTLIELLVTISIIGILSAFLLANFVGVRQRARDGVRKSDLRQIQQALELYRSDKGSYLPSATLTCGYSMTDGGVVTPPTPPTSAVIYMQKIPCDPSANAAYSYNPSSDNTSYSITGCLENANDAQRDSSVNSACDSTTKISYTLQNP